MKQKKFIVLVAVVMVLVLCFSVFAACNKKKKDNGPQYSPDSEVIDPQVAAMDAQGTFSYRMGPSDLPTSWNMHTYQSNSSTYILDYTSDGLYTFDYKDDSCSSFTIVPSMAKDYPIDITSELAADPAAAAKWGLDADSKNKAYKIRLKTNLKFDNGDPITANTFVESMKLLLDSGAANFRADNVYKSGDLKIQGAEAYSKSGTTTYDDCTAGEGVGQGEFTGWDAEAENYGLSDALLEKMTFWLTGPESYVGNWAKGVADKNNRTLQFILTYYTAGLFGNLTSDQVWGIFETMSGMTLKQILESEVEIPYIYTDDKDTEDESDDEEVEDVLTYQDVLEILLYDFWCTDPDEEFGFFVVITENAVIDYDTVGFYAADDYDLVIILKNPMEDNFYLRYELCSSFFLVHPELYKQCISHDNNVYTNSYGTSVEKYIGYGPYKLTQYVADSTIILERNNNWHGYTEGEYVKDTYQTNRVVYTKVTESATRLEMFLRGELDSYGLQAEDMKDYISSEYIVYTDSESTWYLAMNPDEATLATREANASPVTPGNTVVKRVLCLENFRKALSYCIDRKTRNLTLNPTSGIAKALLSAAIVADPEEGFTYRSYDIAKDAILSFWGLADQWGEGKEYKTRDAAIASITGYDPAGARELFTAAYNEARELGYIPAGDNWEVQIVWGDPSGSTYYQKAFEFTKTNWTQAVVGTPFEGHIQIIKSQVLGSTTFGTYLRNGSVDVLTDVGYSGSRFNPYSMMECFTGRLQYDTFTDMKTKYLDITYDFGEGVKTYRASLYNWISEALQGDTITVTEIVNGEATTHTYRVSAGSSDPFERRITILAKCEEAIMNLANIFPLSTDASASLRGMRINYKTEEYVLGMGFGGIQYYTYAMNDADFAAYVESEGGTLNYK